MILKPRIDVHVAMILAGAFFAFVGFGAAYLFGLPAGFVPAILGVLGLLWITGSIAGIWHRRHFVITIDSSGISVPTGNVFRPGPSVHIPRDVIATIGSDESVRGRFVSIALRSGGKVPIQARNYCELKDFVSRCKDHGLPTA